MTYSLGWREFQLKPFLGSLIAEFFGTMLLVIIGCGAAVNFKTVFDITQVSLAFGLAVTSIVCVIGKVSGGHINPAVSLGMLVGGEMPLLQCFSYIIVQCIGAITGSAILYAVTPATFGLNKLGQAVAIKSSLGLNGLGPVNQLVGPVSPRGGLLLELILTMLLVLVIYATAVDKKSNISGGLAPLLIGLTVTVAHLVLIPFTGTSINPARSLGPALITGNLKDHWVFWVGPLMGGALGGVLYNFLLRNPSALGKTNKEAVQFNGETVKISEETEHKNTNDV